MRKLTFLLLFTFCLLSSTNAQEIKRFDFAGQGPHLISFPALNQPTLEELPQIFAKYYPIKAGYSWKEIKQLKDELGFTHSRYQFYYDDVKILGSMLIVHAKNNQISEINGRFYPAIKQENSIDKESALNKALTIVNAEKYMWQDVNEEKALKEMENDPSATYYPQPELIYVPNQFDYNQQFILCYQVKVYAKTPLSYKEYYISASSGDLVSFQDLIMEVHDTGTAVTAYSGIRTIFTDSTAPTNYRLKDSIRDVWTLNMQTGTNYGLAVEFTDADNYWSNINANKDEVATDAHWGAEMTYDYFLKEHNRNSYDDNGARILSYVHYRSNYDNAFWDGRRMTYGDGMTFKPLTSLDVCGHEIAHAVTTNTAGLIYRNESGQLNESFSDIFGNTVEAWARPSQHSWVIGEDITTSGNGLRNMQNPNLRNHPKYYKGFRWYYGTGDNGGVHLNSGVQNYWYYLMVEGDTGINENLDTYEVESLGLTKAAKIAYRNLSVYLTPSSDYAEARVYAIKSAADLYGQCSKEVINTTNAWFVCGVGARYDSTFVAVDFTADTLICSTSQIVNFSNRSTNFKRCIWSFGDGDTSSMIDATHQYNTYQSYDIKLKAESCFGNQWDSMTKKLYVVVDSSQDICNAIFMPSQGTDSLSFCTGFIYDEGGLGNYKQAAVTYLKITSPGADSISITFQDLDYEKDYDTLTLYQGAPIAGNEIGKYFDSNLPNGGAPIVILGNYISLRQWSDPFVVGRGFKAKYQAHKAPLEVAANKDTTLCRGTGLNLQAVGAGGWVDDYRYLWNNDTIGAAYEVFPKKDSTYSVQLMDVCTKEIVYDSVVVTLRDSLKLIVPNDTLICANVSLTINLAGLGGKTPYQFVWDQGLGAGATKNISPNTKTTFQIVLSDNCTVKNDTGSFTVSVRQPLSVNILASDTILCDNQLVTLKATQNGGDTALRVLTWEVDGSNSDSVTFVPSASGWYRVMLSDNCSPSVYDSIYLQKLSPLSINKQNDTIICQGSDIDIFVSASGGKPANYSYTWNNNIGDTNRFTKSVNQKTSYSFLLSDGCSPSITDSIVVDVLPDLALIKPKDSTLCYGEVYDVQLSASGGFGSNYTYAWNNGLGMGQSKSLQPFATTNYQLVLSDRCTVENDTQQFTVTVRDKLLITASSNPIEVCEGESSMINYVISGGKTPLAVQMNGSFVSNNPITVFPTLNANSYKLRLTDGCSYADSTVVTLTVHPLPYFRVVSNKQSLCIGDSVTFNNDFAGIGQYDWELNNVQKSTQSSFNWKPTTIGDFTAILSITDINNCTNKDTLMDQITVLNPPVANFTFSPNVPDIENNLISFTNQSTFGNVFEWNFGDNSGLDFNSNPSHSYVDTGTYTISLRATNSIGCENIATQKIRIKPVYKLYVPSAFSPNGDNINDKFEVLGSGIVSIHIEIFNRWGEKLMEQRGQSVAWDGRLENDEIVPQGVYIYFMEIMDINGLKHQSKGKIMVLD